MKRNKNRNTNTIPSLNTSKKVLEKLIILNAYMINDKFFTENDCNFASFDLDINLDEEQIDQAQ